MKTMVTITSTLTPAERQRLVRAVRVVAERSGAGEAFLAPVQGKRLVYEYVPGDYGNDVHAAIRRMMTAIGRTFTYQVNAE